MTEFVFMFGVVWLMVSVWIILLSLHRRINRLSAWPYLAMSYLRPAIFVVIFFVLEIPVLEPFIYILRPETFNAKAAVFGALLGLVTCGIFLFRIRHRLA